MAGYFFLLHCFYLRKILSVNSAFLGTFVITLPLLVLFFARFIDDTTCGNISVANAYLADISSDKNRSNNFGKMAISLSSNLRFIVGPALAAILVSNYFILNINEICYKVLHLIQKVVPISILFCIKNNPKLKIFCKIIIYYYR